MRKNEKHFPITELLSRGAANGTKRTELMALAGCNDREIRLLIQRERLEGSPILSDTVNGYYLPADENEVTGCVKILRRMAAETFRTAAAIEAAAGVQGK